MNTKFFGLPALAMSALVTGCANVSVAPPEARPIEKAVVHQVGYDDAWNRAVDWFASKSIPINKLAKDSGLITAEEPILVSGDVLDCGSIKESGTISTGTVNRAATLNLTLRPVSDTATRVTVNFAGFGEFQGRDSWDARQVLVELKCTSTGSVERNIHQFIGG
ncbi:hypothetical protein IMZ29_18595 [Achromobacter sp. GG226]|uniref:hypothetical protein n=1 Tax=Verticiella alkaliphila TaxID=2779529 RepID=UPI001C0D7B0B|nr:hypothetical protein [Verticiella sp. GG226]MBU4612480.1 hypothetical protein [Verticiella sp. GG226]